MAIPAKIRIKRIPDYYTKCIGKYADGQFMALITATMPEPIPKDWEQHKRWYSVLHTFYSDGRHRARKRSGAEPGRSAMRWSHLSKVVSSVMLRSGFFLSRSTASPLGLWIRRSQRRAMRASICYRMTLLFLNLGMGSLIHRAKWLNPSWQPTPGGCLVSFLSPGARRGCIPRYAVAL